MFVDFLTGYIRCETLVIIADKPNFEQPNFKLEKSNLIDSFYVGFRVFIEKRRTPSD